MSFFGEFMKTVLTLIYWNISTWENSIDPDQITPKEIFRTENDAVLCITTIIYFTLPAISGGIRLLE